MQDNHFVETFKVQSYPSTLAYDIFIDETISSPEYYRNVINVLNRAAEGDVLNIYLNTVGGYVSSSSAITAAMDQCKGHIVVHMAAEVCSAGTMIALHGNEWVVGDGICFMCHNVSFSCGGSAEKVKDHHDFIQDWNKSLLEREYSGFLTPEEISNMFTNGKEYWFNAEEVKSRLKNFVDYREGSYKEAMNQMFDQQIAAEDEALDAGLNHLLSNGKVTRAEVDAIKKITPLLDEAFESGEIDLDNLPKSVETLTGESHDYTNAFTIKVKDEIAAICMYTLDEDGIISESVLDIAEYDDEVIVSNIWLEDNLDRSELITLAKDIGVKGVAHNTKDTSVIINKIINYVDGLIEEEEKS